MTRRVRLYRPGVLLFALTFASCGGGGGGGGGGGSGGVGGAGESSTAPATLNRLEIDAPTSTLTAIGEEVQLAVRGFDAQGGAVTLPAVQWSSSFTGVVEISSAGRITAAGNGVSDVQVAVGSVSASLSVTVTQKVATIEIGGPSLIKAIGAQANLTARAKDRNGHLVSGATVTWRSGAASIVDVDSTGRVTAKGVGMAVLTAEAQDVVAHITIDVATVFRVPVDSYLANPTPGALWEVPVVLLAYIPTGDGVNLDVSKSPGFNALDPRTVAAVEEDILDIVRRKKMALEEGSRFRAYKNPSSVPSIGIRVVEQILIYDQIAGSTRQYGGANLVDYKRAFSDLALESLISTRGVKQVWLAYASFDASFPSYNPAIHKLADTRLAWESNMASPTTGDVSNSDRDPSDLPVLGHTYVVYGINFRRSQAEAVHNVGHHLEATLAFANQRTEGTSDLFWKQFVGQDSSGNFVTGRAGWTHMPPNTTQDYAYLNPTSVVSDIEDWRPDGAGAKKAVNVNTWGSLIFPWPGAMDFPQRVETQWYIYWFQNMPGADNRIPRGAGEMTNWWRFMADWDAAIAANSGLATAGVVAQGIAIRNDFASSVFLDPGGTLEPGQSTVIPAAVPTVVRVYDCGDPSSSSCIMDPYTLEPGRAYRVIQHPSGPANNLTIVLQ